MSNEEMIVALGLLRDQLIRDQVKASAAEPAVNGAAVRRDDLTVTNHKLGICQALETMLQVAADWAEISAQNDSDSRDPEPAEQQKFFLTDIRQMVNDVARELGVDRPWKGKGR